MKYTLEQIRQQCDGKVGFTIPKNCLGERSKGYPMNKPTTYVRKWDFRDVPAEVLSKYDLEPIQYIYCGSHTQRTQRNRDYLFYYDILLRKSKNRASKEIREFFVNYVNYFVNEKKENLIEVVERFFKAKEMIYLNNKYDIEIAERHINDRYLVEQAHGKKIKVLSTSPRDTTLILDSKSNRLKERKNHIGEYKNLIDKTTALHVSEYIKNNKNVAEVYRLMNYYLEKVDFIEY